MRDARKTRRSAQGGSVRTALVLGIAFALGSAAAQAVPAPGLQANGSNSYDARWVGSGAGVKDDEHLPSTSEAWISLVGIRLLLARLARS